jgi:integrase/recombinase XerD
MSWSDLRVLRSRSVAGDLVVRFGVAVLDAYLEFLAVRSRPNTVAAVAYDLKVFFTVVGKPPQRVVAADVLAFVTAQYAGGPARRGRAGHVRRVGGAGRACHASRRRVCSSTRPSASARARSRPDSYPAA